MCVVWKMESGASQDGPQLGLVQFAKRDTYYSRSSVSDFDTIRKALKALRRISGGMRYGGLAHLYELAGDALAALKRIEQPTFWSLPPDPPTVERERQGALL